MTACSRRCNRGLRRPAQGLPRPRSAPSPSALRRGADELDGRQREGRLEDVVRPSVAAPSGRAGPAHAGPRRDPLVVHLYGERPNLPGCSRMISLAGTSPARSSTPASLGPALQRLFIRPWRVVCWRAWASTSTASLQSGARRHHRVEQHPWGVLIPPLAENAATAISGAYRSKARSLHVGLPLYGERRRTAGAAEAKSRVAYQSPGRAPLRARAGRGCPAAASGTGSSGRRCPRPVRRQAVGAAWLAAPTGGVDRDLAVVEGGHGRPVRDADHGGAGQAPAQEFVHVLLGRLVERRRRLVEEQPVGAVDEGAREAQALLLATR